MKRREFITVLGGAAAWPLAANAQQMGRVYRIGLVFTTSRVAEMTGPDPIHPLARTFVHSLRTLGYLQGQNLMLEPRSAEGQFERFSEIIAELVSLKVDAHRDGGKPDDSGGQGLDRDGSYCHGL